MPSWIRYSIPKHVYIVTHIHIDTNLEFQDDFSLSFALGSEDDSFTSIDNITLLSTLFSSSNSDTTGVYLPNNSIAMDLFLYDRVLIELELHREFGWDLQSLSLKWVMSDSSWLNVPAYEEETLDVFNDIYTFMMYYDPTDSESEHSLPFTITAEYANTPFV